MVICTLKDNALHRELLKGQLNQITIVSKKEKIPGEIKQNNFALCW